MSSTRGRKSKDDTVSIKDGHRTTIQSDHEVTDCFKKYFCTIGKKINSAIEIPIDKINISAENKPISIYSFDCIYTEAFNLLQKFDVNKETGFGRIPGKVLKLCANILAYLVSNLVSLSFAKFIFADCLKHAKVCPIHKVGAVRKVEIFRPISVLPPLRKIFEWTRLNRLYDFLMKENQQFGFLHKRSKVDVLI